MSGYRKLFVLFEAPQTDHERAFWTRVLQAADMREDIASFMWLESRVVEEDDVYVRLAKATGVRYDPGAPGSIYDLVERAVKKLEGGDA